MLKKWPEEIKKLKIEYKNLMGKELPFSWEEESLVEYKNRLEKELIRIKQTGIK